MRLIHAVRDLSAQTGTPVETVALYTDADRTATFVREADLAYPLGPASARPYLDYAVLERALVETGADAAWVGWGFVAEDPVFAELCEKLGVTFIGPDADAMRKLGDKIGAKLIAEEVGVPVAPWSRGAVATLDDALARGGKHRLPADAQGHRGRRRARHPRHHLPRRPHRGVRADKRRRRCARSAAAPCSLSASSPAPGTSRSRSSPTGRARPGPSASATARCSGATRRSSRSRRPRCSAPSRQTT